MCSSSSSPALFLFFFVFVAAAGAQGGDHSEARSGLVGSLLVQALPRLHRLPAVLHPQDEGQARAEEAEDRSSLSGALQEAQQRHGEQDHAAAEENRRAGQLPFLPSCLHIFAYRSILISSFHDLSLASRTKKTGRSTTGWSVWRVPTRQTASGCVAS